MERRTFAEAVWTRRPRVPFALAGGAIGVAITAALLGVARALFGAHAFDSLPVRIGTLAAGISLVGGSIALLRSRARRRPLRVAPTAEGLRIGDRLLPHGSIQRVEYAHDRATGSMAPGSEDRTVDSVLVVHTTERTVRLVALDTVVTDFATALAPIEQANPEAIVGPALPRSWKSDA